MWKRPETNLRNPNFPLIKTSRLHPHIAVQKSGFKTCFCHRQKHFFEKIVEKFCRKRKKSYLCNAKAQMAESVDALVSNTSGATHPGSIPGLGTMKSCK